MGSDEVEALKQRVAQLEMQLQARREPQDVSADEIRAFRKVSELLAADWGEFCGINDCYRPPILRCVINPCIVRCVVRCIQECTCGPCNLGQAGLGGISRFEQFGG